MILHNLTFSTSLFKFTLGTNRLQFDASCVATMVDVALDRLTDRVSQAMCAPLSIRHGGNRRPELVGVTI